MHMLSMAGTVSVVRLQGRACAADAMNTYDASGPGSSPLLLISAAQAKKIATIYAIYLVIPFPWDWAPILGDLFDLLSVLVAYNAMKSASVAQAAPRQSLPIAAPAPRGADVVDVSRGTEERQ